MKNRSVTINELMKDNKRICLSALRVFGECDKCEVMKRYYQDKTRKEPIGAKICESAVFSKERLGYLEEQGKIKEQINELNKKLLEIDTNLKGV
ncbi:MAG: hypothetical protein AABY22_03065 [Nanoarchaeota archaeon]